MAITEFIWTESLKFRFNDTTSDVTNISCGTRSFLSFFAATDRHFTHDWVFERISVLSVVHYTTKTKVIT